MKDKNTKQDKTENKAAVSHYTLELYQGNSKLARRLLMITTIGLLLSIIYASYVSGIKSQVVLIPNQKIWAAPSIHYSNSPKRVEENAKPFYVALKYINALYEIDIHNFTEVGDKYGPVLLNEKITNALSYVIKGSDEEVALTKKLAESQSDYRKMKECMCVQRFLITDLVIDSPSYSPAIKVRAIGRYVMFGADGREPLPAEDLGYKIITIYMVNGSPAFGKDANSQELIPLNPERIYIIDSSISTVSLIDYEKIKKERLILSEKGVY